MIDTLMAVWNKGYGGRSIIVFFAFFLICISISLLLVTTSLPWGALFPQSGPPNDSGTTLDGANLTATAHALRPSPTAAKSPTAIAKKNPCTVTPVVSKTPVVRGTQRASGGGQNGATGGSTSTANTSGGSQPTPTKTTVLPTPRPTITPSPRPGTTPTVVATNTPTPVVTPTDTPTPVPPETPTPTLGITPTVAPTSTPGETPTAVPTLPILTPTVSRDNGSPTPTSNVPNAGGKHAITPVASADPSGRGSAHESGGSTLSTNCLSASLLSSGEDTAIASLAGDLWFIFGGAGLCTLLFCVGIVLFGSRRS